MGRKREDIRKTVSSPLTFNWVVQAWGFVLFATLFLPVEATRYLPEASQETLFLWDLVGVIGLAPFLEIAFPGMAGVVFVLIAWLGRDSTLLAIVVFCFFVTAIFVLGLDPMSELTHFHLWVASPGHRLILVLACFCSALSCESCVRYRKGAAWGATGAALVLAYLLTPTLDGMVPLAETLEKVMVARGDLQWIAPILRLVAEFGLLVGAAGTLMSVQTFIILGQNDTNGAVLSSWIMKGLFSALLFPLIIAEWKASSDPIQGLVIVREFFLFSAFLPLFPSSFVILSQSFGETGRRNGNSTTPRHS